MRLGIDDGAHFCALRLQQWSGVGNFDHLSYLSDLQLKIQARGLVQIQIDRGTYRAFEAALLDHHFVLTNWNAVDVVHARVIRACVKRGTALNVGCSCRRSHNGSTAGIGDRSRDIGGDFL